MGTRSMIAVKRSESQFEAIYCHWDGYLDGVGQTLRKHYTDQAKVDALMQLGDLSSLGPDVGEKHPFDAGGTKTCTAYGRDRGEEGIESITVSSFERVLQAADGCGAEFVYLYDGGRWHYTEHGEFRAFGVGPTNGKPSPWKPLEVVPS